MKCTRFGGKKFPQRDEEKKKSEKAKEKGKKTIFWGTGGEGLGTDKR